MNEIAAVHQPCRGEQRLLPESALLITKPIRSRHLLDAKQSQLDWVPTRRRAQASPDVSRPSAQPRGSAWLSALFVRHSGGISGFQQESLVSLSRLMKLFRNRRHALLKC